MMATYFHGNSDQIQAADHGGLQTLVLMNHGYVPYPDTPPPPAQPPTNLVFLNPPPPLTNSLPPHAHFSHAPPSHAQQFVTFPLPSTTSNTTTTTTSPSSQYDVSVSALHGSFIPHVQYNLWNPVGVDPSTASRETPRAQQGLSLSLSSEHPDAGYGSFQTDQRHEVLPSSQSQAQQAISGRSPNSSASGTTVNIGARNNMQRVLLSSRYMRATQELLEEVVSVGNNGVHTMESLKKGGSSLQQMKLTGESSVGASGDGSIGSEATTEKHGNSELSTAERQEIQMKKAKLISMLDEVEQRYRQYHHQMQIVTSAFEQVAGTGSARTYTSLALLTISKQFRCLKDTITSQIRAANKRLGEEESLGKKEGSRLKYVDHHLRQQRALQKLGMIQQNAWRPQRGLPERSVSVLRAWLFEHFLHPYPKDSDKHMLAKQTGLTRSQVSNWFINARVRLWKPMVEEMYLEEIKEQEQNGSEGGNKRMNKTNANNNEDSTISKSASTLQEKSCAAAESQSQPPTSPNAVLSPVRGNVRNQSGFITLIGSSELDGITQGSPKKLRDSGQEHNNNSNEHVFMNYSNENQQSRDGYSFMGGFGQYPIGEIVRFEADQFTSRFSSGNGVSLTLGLPHGENLSLSAAHQTFLPPNQSIHLGRREEMEEQNEFGAISSSTTVPHSSSTAFDNFNIQNRKRFAAQLFPDYVS